MWSARLVAESFHALSADPHTQSRLMLVKSRPQSSSFSRSRDLDLFVTKCSTILALANASASWLFAADSLKNAAAENFLDDLGAQEAIDKADSWLQPYLKIDVSGFARNLDLGGDVITVEKPEGGVWVWRGW